MWITTEDKKINCCRVLCPYFQSFFVHLKHHCRASSSYNCYADHSLNSSADCHQFALPYKKFRPKYRSLDGAHDDVDPSETLQKTKDGQRTMPFIQLFLSRYFWKLSYVWVRKKRKRHHFGFPLLTAG